jgi:hypothetical protein
MDVTALIFEIMKYIKRVMKKKWTQLRLLKNKEMRLSRITI